MRQPLRHVLAALLLLGSFAPVPATGQTALYAGKPLAQVLSDLKARGLRLVFSSQLVRPEMTVVAEPTAGEPRAVLEEVLAVHGLGVQEAPGGILVVVAVAAPAAPGSPAPERHTLRGSVRSRPTLRPLPDATVVVLETGDTARTAADGLFVIGELEAGTYTLEARLPGFVIQQESAVVPASGDPASAEGVLFALVPSPLEAEEIVVVPSQLSILRETPVSLLGLSRQDVLALPHLGDDVFRALSLLPGTTANDVTAQLQVRGGWRDEVQVLLDGQEIYDAFHLEDFDNALSIVGSAALGGVDLTTGGYQAEYGDRSSGVLDMTTAVPRDAQHQVGLSLLTAQAGTSGTFQEGRGSWLALMRRGSADLAGRLIREEAPEYWDVHAKGLLSLGARDQLSLHLLRAGDVFDLEEADGEEVKQFHTDYDSSYVWLTHQRTAGSRLLVETAVARSDVDRDRRGLEDEEEQHLEVRDLRRLDVTELRQRWDLLLTRRHDVRAGWALRRFEAEIDYCSAFAFETPLARLRGESPDGEIAYRDRSRADHRGFFLVDHVRLADALTVELGLRHDRYSLPREQLWSPRLNLALRLGEASLLRAAWGRFYQSQRPGELQVEDGDPRFYPAEQSEHRILGFDHVFTGRHTLALRLELYQRRVRNPRPRHENLYEPLNTFPEIEPDRVRLSPESARAEGFEIFLRGSRPLAGAGQATGRRLGWWLAYSRSSIEDRLDGRDVPRNVDQPDTLSLDLDYPLGRHWRVNLAWRYHTGWPTTPLTVQAVEDEDGEVEFVPVLGPLRSRRLPDYHRLDLRISRRWELRRGAVVFFADVQNLYDRRNVAGFDLEIDEDTGDLLATEEEWLSLTPSAGLRWEF